MEAIRRFFAIRPPGRDLRILDIGCGDGETLRRIRAYGRRQQVPLRLTGMDVCPHMIAAANKATSQDIHFIQADATALGHVDRYDVIISSLTMHHLANEAIVRLMCWMTETATVGWFISDLNRHAVAYHFIKYFTSALRFNPLICHDAPLSVARAFRREEWMELLKEAGIRTDQVKVTWYPNFRYGVRYEHM
jgi:2-polyprenyl-3-methyl-5-hydroxy-6-metoxy-1,4-benzoquinol methylase